MDEIQIVSISKWGIFLWLELAARVKWCPNSAGGATEVLNTVYQAMDTQTDTTQLE